MGNSCRSQMAEGFAKKYLSDQYEVYSAGIEAHGLNPLAIKAMKAVGIDISNQTSDVIDRDLLNKADFVIILCGDAKETCPTPPAYIGGLMTRLKRKVLMRKNRKCLNVFAMKLKSE